MIKKSVMLCVNMAIISKCVEDEDDQVLVFIFVGGVVVVGKKEEDVVVDCEDESSRGTAAMIDCHCDFGHSWRSLVTLLPFSYCKFATANFPSKSIFGLSLSAFSASPQKRGTPPFLG